MSPGAGGVQERLRLIPPTPDTKLLQHSPLIGSCSTSGPKPLRHKNSFSLLQLASSTTSKPGTPLLNPFKLNKTATKRYINVKFSHLTQSVTLAHISDTLVHYPCTLHIFFILHTVNIPAQLYNASILHTLYKFYI